MATATVSEVKGQGLHETNDVTLTTNGEEHIIGFSESDLDPDKTSKVHTGEGNSYNIENLVELNVE